MKITITHYVNDDDVASEVETTNPLEAEQMIADMAKEAIVIDDERFDGPGTLYAGRIEWTVTQ